MHHVCFSLRYYSFLTLIYMLEGWVSIQSSELLVRLNVGNNIIKWNDIIIKI